MSEKMDLIISKLKRLLREEKSPDKIKQAIKENAELPDYSSKETLVAFTRKR